ncbi:MAG: hypothetical protein HZB91_09140, partial [Elusimicrobia bacterium]|nr:hypothetical protein [Elusimicrobiota bacterium]
MSRGNLLLVSSDRGLLEEVVGSDKGKEFDTLAVPTLNEARTQIERGFDRRRVNVLVFDLKASSEDDCLRLLEGPGAANRHAVFLLKPDLPMSPSDPQPLRDLSWPLPAKFVDEVAAAANSVVFLVDRPVFLAHAIELSFKPTGIQPVVLQTTDGIVELIAQVPNPALKEKGFYGRLLDGLLGRDETPAAVPAPLPNLGTDGGLMGHVVAVLYEGSRDDAAAFDADLRRKVPGVVCFRLSNVDPLVEAGKALASGAPVRLSRAQA